MKEEPASSDFIYDTFISYSNDPDYQLSRKIESFLESFHKLKTGSDVKLKPLSICRDGSDFSLHSIKQEAAKTSKSVRYVNDVLITYLKQSRYLLVLCSRNAALSEFVQFEIKWFVENKGPDLILFAVTEGSNLKLEEKVIFSELIITHNLQNKIFFDLRGFKREARQWLKVRDHDEELTNIAAFLNNETSGKILPLWRREERKKLKRQRYIVAAAALVFLGLAIFGWVQERISNAESKKNKALFLSSESDRYGESEKLALLNRALKIDPANEVVRNKIYSLLNSYESYNPFAVAAFTASHPISSIGFSGDAHALRAEDSLKRQYSLQVLNNKIDSIPATKDSYLNYRQEEKRLVIFKTKEQGIDSVFITSGETLLDFDVDNISKSIIVLADNDKQFFYRTYSFSGKLLAEERFSKGEYEYINFSPKKKLIILTRAAFHLVKNIVTAEVTSFEISGSVVGSDSDETRLLFYDQENPTNIAIRVLKQQKTVTSPAINNDEAEMNVTDYSAVFVDSIVFFIVQKRAVEGPAGQYTRILKWNTGTNKIEELYANENTMEHYSFSADKHHLILADESDSVHTINVFTKKKESYYKQGLISAGYLGTSGYFFVHYSTPKGNAYEVYDSSKRLINYLEYSESADSIVISPDNKYVAVAYNHNAVLVWKLDIIPELTAYRDELTKALSQEYFTVKKFMINDAGNRMFIDAQILSGQSLGVSIFLNNKPVLTDSVEYINSVALSPGCDSMLVSIATSSFDDSYLWINGSGNIAGSVKTAIEKLNALRYLSLNQFNFQFSHDTVLLVTKSNRQILLGEFASIVRNWGELFCITDKTIYCTIPPKDSLLFIINQSGVRDSLKINELNDFNTPQHFDNVCDYYNHHSADSLLVADSTWFYNLKKQFIENQNGAVIPLNNLYEYTEFRFSKDAQRLFFVHDGSLIIATFPKGGITQVINSKYPIVSGKFYDNEKKIAFITADGAIHLWYAKPELDSYLSDRFIIPFSSRIKSKYEL